MSTSHELARWRAAKAKSTPNSPLLPRRSPAVVRPAASPIPEAAPEPARVVEDYAALLEGCTSVQVDSIATSSDGGRDSGVKKAVDGSASTYYCTETDGNTPVEVQMMLSGRFNIRKIDILWKHAPVSFSVQFSSWDGERFQWQTVSEKQVPDGSRPQELFIGNAGFARHTGSVKILMKPEDGQLGISDIQIFGSVAPVSLKSIQASSDYSKEYGAQVLCAPDGPGWSSGANPKEPVLLTVELTGKFHVRKLVLRWTHGGPSHFQVLFSETGEEDTWAAYPVEASRFPVQSVIFTQEFYERSTGYIRVELAGKNHPKYYGVEELQVMGDLDLIWRAQAVAEYQDATASLESPKSSLGKAHKAASRPVSSPVVPVPKTVLAAPLSSSKRVEPPPALEEADGVSKATLASKDAEIAALRDENARLKAEAARMKSKLRDAKSIIDSLV